MAISHDKFGRTKTINLKSTKIDCPPNHYCFEQNIKENQQNFCHSEGKTKNPKSNLINFIKKKL